MDQFYQWKKTLLNSADKVYRSRKKKDPEKEKLKDKNKGLNAEQKRQLMNIVEKSTLPIKKTCSVLKLNPSRYYDWQRRFDGNGTVRSSSVSHIKSGILRLHTYQLKMEMLI